MPMIAGLSQANGLTHTSLGRRPRSSAYRLESCRLKACLMTLPLGLDVIMLEVAYESRLQRSNLFFGPLTQAVGLGWYE